MSTPNFEWSDVNSTRKALLSASTTTIILANIELTSDTVKILGLTAKFDLMAAIAVAQLLTTIILVVFLLRLSASYRILINDRRLERKLKPTYAELAKFYDDFDTGPEPTGNYDKDLKEEVKYWRASNERLSEVIARSTENKVHVVVNQIFPITLALSATLCPTAPLRIANWIF